MAIEQQRMTLDEFLALPEQEPALELEPDGTVIQKMSPKGKHSTLQGWFAAAINSAAQPQRRALALPELRAVFGGAAYVPDISVYRWDRIAWGADGEIPDDFTEPPDIAIEIVSPGQSVNSSVRRSIWYVEKGVQIALLVDAYDRSVVLFRAGINPRALRGADPIDISDILPGFELTADQVFAALRG